MVFEVRKMIRGNNCVLEVWVCIDVDNRGFMRCHKKDTAVASNKVRSKEGADRVRKPLGRELQLSGYFSDFLLFFLYWFPFISLFSSLLMIFFHISTFAPSLQGYAPWMRIPFCYAPQTRITFAMRNSIARIYDCSDFGITLSPYVQHYSLSFKHVLSSFSPFLLRYLRSTNS